MRHLVLLFVTVLVAPCASAEEPPLPAPLTCTIAPGPVPAQPVDVPGVVTALARGRAGEEILLALDDGQVLRLDVTRGLESRDKQWRATTGGAPAEALVAAPTGEFLAAATATELIVFGATPGEALWRLARPVAFSFDGSGARLITVSKEGEVAEWEAATGKQLALRMIEERRAVVKASLHAASGLAVLGIADG